MEYWVFQPAPYIVHNSVYVQVVEKSVPTFDYDVLLFKGLGWKQWHAKLNKKLREPEALEEGIKGAFFSATKGYIPVAVGVDQETKRFMVHTTALSNAEFVQLLCRSAEEYGFCNKGILRIPYDAKAFEEWMSRSTEQKIIRVQPMSHSGSIRLAQCLAP
ncbi:UNVERIFIED_CONTAM: Auxin-responsive protein SAUR40 [Sesamum calycinum]|uniref:Auxin-responsive protein SAUR40 n=1 Tax=Sesamum calycinum TaxID=2727403 RepID=A0AAW2MMA1_9LAMI